MKDKTKSNEYEPTNAEKKLLSILFNPEHRFASITKTCELAGVSRNSYYDAFDKPEFVGYYKKKARDIVDQAVMPVINTFKKMAIAGSFQHGKALLDMAKMSEPIRIQAMNFNFDTDDPKEAQRAYAELIKGEDE